MKLSSLDLWQGYKHLDIIYIKEGATAKLPAVQNLLKQAPPNKARLCNENTRILLIRELFISRNGSLYNGSRPYTSENGYCISETNNS